MRFIKILATIFISLLVIVLVGGYIFIHNFDLNKYKPQVYELVAKETGRKLVINGEAEMGISLLPTIVLNEVELSNPSWAKNPNMITAKQIKVQLAVMPLLKKQIVLNEVSLIGTNVYLEQAANGQASWDFKPVSEAVTQQALAQAPRAAAVKEFKEIRPQAKPEMVLLAGFAANNVLIKDSSLEYLDDKSGQNINLVINQITLNVPALNEDVQADFDVIYDGQKAKGSLVMGSVQTLMEGKHPLPVNLTAEAMGIQLKVNGTVAGALNGSPIYALDTNVYNPAGNLKAPETTLVAKVNGDINQAQANIQTLNIVNNNITGTLLVKWNGAKPYIEANLSSPKINLQSFNQSSNFALALPTLIGEAQAMAMVPDTAIPYKELNLINGKFNLKVAQLMVSPGMQANNVNLQATINNGVLSVNPLQLQFGGGDIDAYLSANANAQNVQIKTTSRNMTLQNLHKEFLVAGANDFGVLSGGNLDLDINVSGSGSTYRQLVNNLNGTAIAIVGPTVLQTGNLNFFTGNFMNQLLAAIGVNTSKSTKLDVTCAVVRSNLGGGMANFPQGIAFNSKQLMLVSDGKINLLNDKIDFSVKPFSGKVVDTNMMQALSSMVRVRGTLQSPKIAIDDKEVLKNVIGIAATGGTAYLGSKLLLDGNSSPCYTALQGTPYANRFPKPTGVQATGQDIYKGTANGIDDSVKALKDTAKDILGIFKKPRK